MLEAVGHPVAVNPDAKLERYREPQRLADRRLQQAHQGGGAAHHASTSALSGVAAAGFAAGTRYARSRVRMFGR